jgi:hypothetical protein
MGLTGGFGLPRSLCRAVFTSGFFFESALDSSADSFDADAVGVAFGFGLSARGADWVEAGVGGADAMGAPSGLVACEEAADGAAVFGASARGGVETGEAGVGGAVAMGAPSGLVACEESADGAAVFGASARGGVETGEAGVGGAVAIGAPSGLIAFEAIDGAAGFGVSARGGAESGEARVGGAGGISVPSARILCVVTSVAPWFSGAGVNAGAGACGSTLSACEGAACGLSCIGARGELEGSRVCSFCGLTTLSVAATEGSRSAKSGALFMRAKLTPIIAAPASASPPTISFQLREPGLVDF